MNNKAPTSFEYILTLGLVLFALFCTRMYLIPIDQLEHNTLAGFITLWLCGALRVLNLMHRTFLYYGEER